MKKFTKVLEDIDNNRYYEVFSDVKLFIKATNEGEAAYKSDSILGAIEGQIDFSIALIEEIPKEEYQKYFENVEETKIEHNTSNYIISYTKDSTKTDVDISIASEDLEDLVKRLKSHLSDNEFKSIYKIEIGSLSFG
jgi:uncharacterized lipoprotein YehR (DUF1307 family)